MTEERKLQRCEIEWGEGGDTAYGRKRLAFLRALRAHRVVIGRTDGPTDPAPIAAAIARHIRAVDALGIDGLDGDDWHLDWADADRGRWSDPGLLAWAAEAVSHASRVEAYREEAATLRAVRSAARSHERVSLRMSAMAERNGALRSGLRAELGPVVDDVAGPTAPVAPTPDSAATAVKSSGARRPARKAPAAS